MSDQRGSTAPVVAISFALVALVLAGWMFMTIQHKAKDRAKNTTLTQNTNSANTNVVANVNSSVNTNTAANTNTSTTADFGVVIRDSQTGLPISKTAITVYSDNGVRCVTTPCPTNGRSWSGTTDAAGLVTLPANMMDVSVTFTIPGYRGGDLRITGQQQADGSWILETDKSKI